MKIAVGISGSSGVIYGVRLLQALKDTPNSISLVMSEWAKKTLETRNAVYGRTMIRELCECCYENDDLSSAISSGSYGIDATLIAPCSMKTLACIANGISDHLL
jgi:4-hydroxy-3-polyprenylbenzoate decarboxylase